MLCCRLLRPIRSLATINKAGTPAPHAGQISLRPIRTFTIVGRHFEKEEWTCFEFQWLSFSEPWWLRVPSAYRLPLPTPGAAPTRNACPPAPKPAANLAAPIAARRSGTSAFRKSANRIRSGRPARSVFRDHHASVEGVESGIGRMCESERQRHCQPTHVTRSTLFNSFESSPI
jgi:hypothetical protein